MTSRDIVIPVSWGELLDRLTILEIKLARIADPGKLAHVRLEWAALDAVRGESLSPEVTDLATRLRTVNEALWDIEDAIRAHERAKDFGPAFIELARSVYRTNDFRSALKREINQCMNSRLVEEKSYEPYD